MCVCERERERVCVGEVGVDPQREYQNLQREREFFIDNLLDRFHFIIVMIRWTGLAPWEREYQNLHHTGLPRT